MVCATSVWFYRHQLLAKLPGLLGGHRSRTAHKIPPMPPHRRLMIDRICQDWPFKLGKPQNLTAVFFIELFVVLRMIKASITKKDTQTDTFSQSLLGYSEMSHSLKLKPPRLSSFFWLFWLFPALSAWSAFLASASSSIFPEQSL